MQPVHRIALHSPHFHPSADRLNTELLPNKDRNRFPANFYSPSDRWGQTLALQHEALEAEPCLPAGGKLKLPVTTDRTLRQRSAVLSYSRQLTRVGRDGFGMAAGLDSCSAGAHQRMVFDVFGQCGIFVRCGDEALFSNETVDTQSDSQPNRYDMAGSDQSNVLNRCLLVFQRDVDS